MEVYGETVRTFRIVCMSAVEGCPLGFHCSGYYKNVIFTELTLNNASANLATENLPSKHLPTSD